VKEGLTTEGTESTEEVKEKDKEAWTTNRTPRLSRVRIVRM